MIESSLYVLIALASFFAVRRSYTALRREPTTRLLKRHGANVLGVVIFIVLVIAFGDERSASWGDFGLLLNSGIAATLGIVIAALIPAGGRANQRLLRAVRKGDLAGVRKAIASGASPLIAESDWSKRSLLTIAAERGDESIVAELLQYNVPVTQEAAEAAAQSQNAELVRALLDRNTRVDQNELLHIAMYRSSEPLIALLRSRGVRFTDSHLVTAAQLGSIPMAIRVLEDSPHCIRSGSASHAVDVALRGKSRALVDWLLDRGARISGSTERNGSPVWLAVRDGDIALVERLLDCGGTPDAVSDHGDPAVILAIGHRYYAIADLLIRRGANLSAVDGNGRTVVWRAAQFDLAPIERLVFAGADINAKDQFGRTILEDGFFIQVMSPDMIERIIALGARVPAPDSWAGKKLAEKRSGATRDQSCL